jgi:GT2 family glycosyltransferase
MTDGTKIAAVVIGRNEGERLDASLRSVLRARLPLIYVDSGSTDGSVARARSLGVGVWELHSRRPFSAARARNEGLREAQRRWPELEYVLFLDADCILDADFPAAAAATMAAEENVAIVTGHLAERLPAASVYNRLCSIEWNSPAGRIEDFAALGGIMLARVSAIREVGTFNEQVIAGEDSELGVRLSLAGYSAVKIDRPMATHDANMMHFGAWWRRSVRAGHSFAQRFALNGRSPMRDCRRELISAVFWGGFVPFLVLVFLWPTHGWSLILLLGYGVLAWRVYRYYRRSGQPHHDAIIAARFMLYSKFANFLGVATYCLNRVRGTFHIIEYK